MPTKSHQKNYFSSFTTQLVELFVILALFGVFYFFICVPHVTFGDNPSAPFNLNTVYISQRISYIFDLPKTDDFVVFRPENIEADSIGTIEAVTGTGENPLYALRAPTGELFTIPRNRIESKIYFTYSF